MDKEVVVVVELLIGEEDTIHDNIEKAHVRSPRNIINSTSSCIEKMSKLTFNLILVFCNKFA